MANYCLHLIIAAIFCGASALIQEDLSEIEGIGCPYLYTKNGGYCYRYYAEQKTFIEAESACVLDGKKCHLASITDHDEDNYLYGLSGGTTNHKWIGLNDQYQVGSFEWTDGSDVGYTNWYPGHPHNSTGADCVFLRGLLDILFECSFESGFCGFTQDQTNNYDWTRDCCGTPSINTGPNAAFDGSMYIYFETSYPAIGDVTRLISPPIFDPKSCSELSFSYHMYGDTMGDLNIYVTDVGAFSSQSIPQFSISGDQGNQWFTHTITISKDSYQVVFEGIKGQSFTSDVSIDGVIIHSCQGLSSTLPAISWYLSSSCNFDYAYFCKCPLRT